ncbi:hypothetical protein CDAR_394851 [Caerostris darwini]|uniref:Uncharacterized protein n=1 Tax=Caerostris darwini TaxID=1538125 RepID=A0AAV4RRA5_9ARAC|nr:hypothetical protein CDAR_394851 [Caerostris darwini]
MNATCYPICHPIPGSLRSGGGGGKATIKKILAATNSSGQNWNPPRIQDPLNPHPNQGGKPKKDKVPEDMQEISPKRVSGPLTSNYTFHESQPPPSP